MGENIKNRLKEEITGVVKKISCTVSDSPPWVSCLVRGLEGRKRNGKSFEEIRGS